MPEYPYGGLGWPIEPEPEAKRVMITGDHIVCAHEDYETVRLHGSRDEHDLCQCGAARLRSFQQHAHGGTGWLRYSWRQSPKLGQHLREFQAAAEPRDATHLPAKRRFGARLRSALGLAAVSDC